jgi:quercetin dioxygenase-like cupin family protein
MSLSPFSHAAVVLPQQTPVFTAFGDSAAFHLTGAQTQGRCVLFTSIVAPGAGPPPHRHANEDEWFLVLEGRVSGGGQSEDCNSRAVSHRVPGSPWVGG